MECRIGLVQMPVSQDKGKNLAVMAEYVEKCASQGAQIVALPEMFCCPYQTELFPQYAEPGNGQIRMAMSNAARENNVLLIGGSFPELGDNGAIYNSCFIFDEKGNLIGRHRKIHLFDIDIKGGQRFHESETLSAGNELTLVDTEFGVIGVAICFDIRFPELFKLYAEKDAKMVFVPASFNMTTGPAHWELAFRSRAVDNQLFMFGIASARDNCAKYISYGNTIAVSPWGDVINHMDDKEGICICDIDLESINQIREQLPLLHALRRDLFRVEYFPPGHLR